MSLRKWKKRIKLTAGVIGDTVGEAVDTVKEKTAEILDTNLENLDKAKAELAEDIEKGIEIFDEIGLPQEVGDKFQEEIAEFAMIKLEEAWNHPDRKTDT